MRCLGKHIHKYTKQNIKNISKSKTNKYIPKVPTYIHNQYPHTRFQCGVPPIMRQPNTCNMRHLQNMKHMGQKGWNKAEEITNIDCSVRLALQAGCIYTLCEVDIPHSRQQLRVHMFQCRAIIADGVHGSATKEAKYLYKGT